MIKWLYNLNKAYDKVQEPKRVFIAVAVALPGIIMSTLTSASMPLFFSGITYLLILLVLRVMYVDGHMKRYIRKKARK